MSEVWPVLIWGPHGDGTRLLGVYDSREAAFEALRAQPNMTIYVDEAGHVRGRPVKERVPLDGRWFPTYWADGWPEQVKSRQAEAGTTQPGTVVP